MNNSGWATAAAGILILGGCATTSKESARFQEIGRIQGDQILPSGMLKVDNGSLRRLDSGDVIAWVVVELDGRTKRGERSYSAQALSHCGAASPTLSLTRWVTNSDKNGIGRAIDSRTFVGLPVPVTNSSPAITAAARAICSSSERPNVASTTPDADSPEWDKVPSATSSHGPGAAAVAAGAATVGIGVLRGVGACAPSGSTGSNVIGTLFQAGAVLICLPFGIIGGVLGAP